MAVTVAADLRQKQRRRRPSWLAVPVCALLAFGIHAAIVVSDLLTGPPVIHAGPGPDGLAVSPDGRTLAYPADSAGLDISRFLLSHRPLRLALRPL
jgi:hypothetical protein